MTGTREGRTALYRLYDADELLMYVGISSNLEQRWYTHSLDHVWWHLVTRTEVVWFDSREEARAAEKQEHAAGRGAYNFRCTRGREACQAIYESVVAPLASRIRANIEEGRLSAGHVFVDDSETATAWGTSRAALGAALMRLEGERVLTQARAVRCYRAYAVRNQALTCGSVSVTGRTDR